MCVCCAHCSFKEAMGMEPSGQISSPQPDHNQSDILSPRRAELECVMAQLNVLSPWPNMELR
jgi:hypothetical protein